MALQIWMPLDGNLKNNGLDAATITSTDVTFQQTTRYHLTYAANTMNGKYINIALENALPAQHPFTMCIYAYKGTAASGSYYPAMWLSAGEGVNGICLHSTLQRIEGTSIDQNGLTGFSGWNHYLISYNGSKLYYYVNGNKLYEWNYTALPRCTRIQLGRFWGTASELFLSDFRFYDHCLTAKEIEEINKACICHFELQGRPKGNPNLLPHTGPEYGVGYLVKYNSGASVTFDETKKYNGHGTIKIMPASGTTSSGANTSPYPGLTLQANTTYTYSCMIYSTVADHFDYSSLGHWQVIAGGSVHQDSNYVYGNNNIPANTWTRVHNTFTVGAQNATFASFFIYFANTSQTIWVTEIKLEEGTAVTEWGPKEGDLSYPDMTQEHDTSGYCHNAITYGTVVPTLIDSPRYKSAAHFNTGFISAPLNVSLPKYTISCWVKYLIGSKMAIGSSQSPSAHSTTYYLYGDNSWKYNNGEYYFDANIPANAPPKNSYKWVFYTIVYNGSEMRVYRNGVDCGSKATSGNMQFNYISVGGGYSTSMTAECYVVDFRLYANSFTTTQVTELYNTSMEIDSSGNAIPRTLT